MDIEQLLEGRGERWRAAQPAPIEVPALSGVRRRRAHRAGAQLTLVAATIIALVTVGVAAAALLRPSHRTSSVRTAPPPASPSTVAAGNLDALSIAGSPVSVPAHLSGFSDPQLRSYADSLGPVTAVQYRLPGPSVGPIQTTLGGITVLAYEDAPLRSELLQADPNGSAVRSLTNVGPPPAPGSVLGRAVMYWAATQVESGTAMGQPDRITSRYALVSSGSWVVIVEVQNVPKAVADQFVASINA